MPTDFFPSRFRKEQRFIFFSPSSACIQQFVELHRGFPLKRQTVVTCIATLKKSHAEETAVSCLVLGTEASTIYILDPEAFTIMDSMVMPSQPAHISVTGLYDVEFRIVAACRNGSVCMLKRGWNTAKTIATLESQVRHMLCYS